MTSGVIQSQRSWRMVRLRSFVKDEPLKTRVRGKQCGARDLRIEIRIEIRI